MTMNFIQFASLIAVFQSCFISLQLWIHRRNGSLKNRILAIYMFITGTFYESLKNELLTNPKVVGVTQSFQSPGDVITSAGEANWEGKPADQTMLMNWLTVHYDFFELLNIPIVAGRSFSKDFSEDMSTWDGGSYIVNEAAARMMGPGSPVGKWFEHYGHKGKVVGVAKNFHFRSLKQEVAPLAIFLQPFFNRTILIKLRAENMPATLAFIRATWDKHARHYPFSYTFVEDELNRVYQGEQQSGVLLNSFAVFALVIACLGLLGLASFSIQQRTKEIGLRKILGSSIRGIWGLLTKEYAKCILLSSAIAWPLSWYLLNRWLDIYVAHIDIQWWMYVTPAILTLLFAGVVVSSHVLKAAIANPVAALRYE